MNILFLGDIFGEPSIKALEKHLPKIIKQEKADFVIAQAENVSGRKGFVKSDYLRLKAIGIDAFTIGNHVWAKKDIKHIIGQKDLIRPYNVKSKYPGHGTSIFIVKGKTIRISQLMGIGFNRLGYGWKEDEAENFFDAFDKLEKLQETDYHIIDFHGETTSEKNVFGVYVDGKATAVLGTHTHIQTSDAKILPKGTAYITDAGMTGPINSAIGADWDSVYQMMRYGERSVFTVSDNNIELNGVLLSLGKNGNVIKSIKRALR
ncbi:TIGR00282 family metallophosphoesterase [Candidatus Mycoplasma mahonii]|uniref:TIGR00282 family metallophosphoesterase n=1 Tax=Candidatus Mycoplasma mahonii TaxID=3004105 RepID=UPI0026EF56FE|nr:TIGR00282 family metallophosphoesterase [Candidatus Mycoplasma mahonii]WKX02346.1 TIGR00282 family metallophosphoesterase [Candidatus Mycoplasma mahonii]